MGEVNKKRFKEPSAYYSRFFVGIVFIVAAIWLSAYDGFFMTEEELYEQIVNRKLIGNAKQRFAITLQKFLITNFGKPGLMLIPIGGTLGGIYYLWSRIAEYLRYKKKCRLYHEGLIKNFCDIYDDYVPLLSWRRIKMLFAKKKKIRKKKYPSNRKMKKEIKEWEKQYR
jgi:hypothetical protein